MRYLIALLTAATGLLHILVGFGWMAGGGGGTNWILILNGVGYLVLLVLYWMAGGSRGTIRWILLVYTLITLVGYFIIGAGFNGGTIPLVIKAIELLLIILLFLDRGSDRVAVQPAPVASRVTGPTTTTTSYTGTRTVTGPETDAALTGMAASAAAGTSSTATGVAGMAGVAGAAGAAAALDDRVDYSVDRTLAASGEVGNVVEEGMDDVGYATTDMSERVGTVVDTVDAETAGAYDAAHDTAGDMAAEAEDAVDSLGDRAAEVYDSAADMTSETVDYVGDKASDAMDAAGDAVDYMGDKASDAVDYVSDKAGDTVDATGDAMDATGDAFKGGMATIGATMGAVGGRLMDDADTVGDAMEDTGEAARGSLITGSAAVDSIDTRLGDESGGMVAGDAAAMDAADLAAEPSAEQLRAELEDYLRSFGAGSEFRKEIEYVEGIGAVYGQKLRAIGVSTVFDLMVNGATRRGRKHIADQTGIAPSAILTWVNHVDLFRIKGIAQEYADLLEQSGVDTVVELAQRNPSNLHKRMVDINEQKKLVRRLPHASEVQSWVQQAKELRRVVHY